MGVSLRDLLRVPTKNDIVDRFVGLLRLANFPVASWHSGSLQKHTVETESSLYVDLATLIQNIGYGGFIKLAAQIDDAWVDLCAENVFGEARKPAIYTQGTWRLVDSAGIGPVTINPGTFWVANADKSLRYVNIDTVPKTLPLNGSVDLTIQAETAGTKWNVGTDALTVILTPQPGLTGSNVPQSTGTWITQQGADVEANPALVQRCLDKWATLGSGSNDGAYRYYATSASSEITRSEVYSPGGGAVRIIICGPSGPVSTTALTAASTIIALKRPTGVPDVVVSNAIVRAQAIAGIIFPAAGKDPAVAIVNAQAGVDALARATSIGGRVSREKIIAALMSDHVDDLTLTAPVDDFVLGLNEVWVPNYALVAG